MSTSQLRLLTSAACTAAFVLSAGAVSSGAATRPGGHAARPEVGCSACIVVDEEGRALWARGAHRRLPNASTTKMMTALVTVATADLSTSTEVSAAAGSVGGGGLDLQAGDRMQIRDLLVAMLLSSSNEAAAALAEHVGGSEEAFVERMNAFARRLGARDTAFANPHGLDAAGHYSTPADLARIAAAVLDDPVLGEIVATARAAVDTPRGPVVEHNRNVLLESYPGTIGVKTGRTSGAGNVLVAAARRGGETLIAVAMRSVDAAADARQLLDLGFALERRRDRPRSVVVLEQGTAVGTAVVDPGGSTSVVATRTVRSTLSPDAQRLRYEWRPGELRAPIHAGQPLGDVRVFLDDRIVATVPVEAADPVGRGGRPLIPNLLGSLINVVAGVVAVVT